MFLPLKKTKKFFHLRELIKSTPVLFQQQLGLHLVNYVKKLS